MRAKMIMEGSDIAVKVGNGAPEFSAQALVGKKVKKISLKDYKGKWVVLFFWPKDFTYVCPTEVKMFNQLYGEFAGLGAEVIGASTDSVETHKRWAREVLGEISYPMMADASKKISSEYGVLDGKGEVALRGTFIIDPSGVVQSVAVNNTTVGRNVHEILRLLHAFQTEELCQVEWKPGQETLGKK